jgi:hypothetical protein
VEVMAQSDLTNGEIRELKNIVVNHGKTTTVEIVI